MWNKSIVAVAALAVWSVPVAAQTAAPGEKMTVPFRDGSQPRKLIVKATFEGVTIKGYEGKDAIIEGTAVGASTRRKQAEPPPGMHRLDQGTDLSVTEENNVITVNAQSLFRSGHLTIQVPVQTSVSVKTMSGVVSVDNISGEIDLQSMNGGLTVTNASGSVMANSMNGKITASLNKVTPERMMSFSTMNGPIDVTLPSDIKASLRMKANNGSIFTDFDVKLDSPAKPEVEDNRTTGGKYKIKVDRTVRGSINGGGAEIQFTTYNGRIMVHKK